MKVIVVFAMLLSFGMTYAATSLYGACNNDGECMNGLECRELWSDCGGKKQCVCEDDDEASDTSFVYVAAAGKCKSKRTLGQSCDHSGECAYTNGQCVDGKCVCITDLRCKNNKVNGESCSQSADCSYFDVAEWAYQAGICTGGTCGCPADMDRSGANCNRVRGPVKRNNQCRVSKYRKSMQCESGLQCRKCRGSDAYAKCRSGQGMIHASLFGVMLMMLLSLLKMQ